MKIQVICVDLPAMLQRLWPEICRERQLTIGTLVLSQRLQLQQTFVTTTMATRERHRVLQGLGAGRTFLHGSKKAKTSRNVHVLPQIISYQKIPSKYLCLSMFSERSRAQLFFHFRKLKMKYIVKLFFTSI